MKTILVAEDNEVNRELITEILTLSGYHVFTAVDGQEAIELLAIHKPDIILLDLQMPRLTGSETLALIKQNPALNKIPVIVCTASAMQGDREKLLASGFTAYLAKPITMPCLLQVLNEIPIGS
jgi:CheY-like chemotaxis protein